MARGILAGAYQGGFDGGSTNRSKGQDRARTEGLYHGEHVFQVAERVIEVASKYGKKTRSDSARLAAQQARDCVTCSGRIKT
ncbi:MAG: hypothetical protein Ct9H90mP27_6050 [Gammaproteobacteria bacterium]|nr:MAG: hypothetical protein Ct9H90mP27_6050 [Gammaproteobacteria bacterium]